MEGDLAILVGTLPSSGLVGEVQRPDLIAKPGADHTPGTESGGVQAAVPVPVLGDPGVIAAPDPVPDPALALALVLNPAVGMAAEQRLFSVALALGKVIGSAKVLTAVPGAAAGSGLAQVSAALSPELFSPVAGGSAAEELGESLSASAEGVALLTSVDITSPMWEDSPDSEEAVADWAQASLRKRASSGGAECPKGRKATSEIELSNKYEVLGVFG
ncbi:hypothetical protein AAFF_G00061850 [Aldrovandia affinis]|uniref:Uncharacterized protein n=1 Tax=Aldrovandia affinis TaxID=143900 RepID=A0AAD7WER6_9TELE|nr:hypothetical protein AAFF_G00061850 [Aldrovandia affinis]